MNTYLLSKGINTVAHKAPLELHSKDVDLRIKLISISVQKTQVWWLNDNGKRIWKYFVLSNVNKVIVKRTRHGIETMIE